MVSTFCVLAKESLPTPAFLCLIMHDISFHIYLLSILPVLYIERAFLDDSLYLGLAFLYSLKMSAFELECSVYLMWSHIIIDMVSFMSTILLFALYLFICSFFLFAFFPAFFFVFHFISSVGFLVRLPCFISNGWFMETVCILNLS